MLVPYFDILHDVQSWPIYCLLFVNADFRSGNDGYHNLCLEKVNGAYDITKAEKMYDKLVASHPGSRGFVFEWSESDQTCRYQEAVTKYEQFLKDAGVDRASDPVIVKVWW